MNLVIFMKTLDFINIQTLNPELRNQNQIIYAFSHCKQNKKELNALSEIFIYNLKL